VSASPWPGVVDRYRERLPLPAGAEAVTLLEGNTPLLPADALSSPGGPRLWLKLESMNPTASFKDRGMTVAVTAARAAGARTVVCASTGNTAASAAAYAARAGMACVVVLPAGAVAQGKLLQARAAGARTVAIEAGFDGALALVREVAALHPEIALVNSVNPLRLEGQKTAAFEIVDALGRSPAAVVLPVGNAGNISAYHRGFEEARRLGWIDRLPRLFGVQAAGAAPLVDGAEVEHPETVASAIRIGRPASAALAREAVRATGGAFLKVEDREILAAYRDLPRRLGVFAEPASAAAVAGFARLLAQGAWGPDDDVVAVITGHGLKDPGTAEGEVGGGEVRRVPAERAAVEEAILGEAWA
jgi:threonine synthase